MAITVDAPCELHIEHYPMYTYCEAHHIIPQSWQVIWQPPGFDRYKGPQNPAEYPYWNKSPDRPGIKLWDGRTAAICRTGHGNVHWWIVEIMHLINQASISIVLASTQIYARNKAEHPRRTDFEYARYAMLRFTGAGGKLTDLFAKNEWGAI